MDQIECPVDEALLGRMRMCREQALDFLCAADNTEHIREVLLSKKILPGLDDTFQLELSVVKALLGDLGKQRLLKGFLACLPTASTRVTLAEACANAAALMKSPVKLVTSRETQGQAQAWVELLTDMRAGISPSAQKLMQDDAYQQIGQQLEYFFTAVGDDGKEYSGRNAIELAIQRMRQAAIARDYTMEDMTKFHAFRLASHNMERVTRSVCIGRVVLCGIWCATGFARKGLCKGN